MDLPADYEVQDHYVRLEMSYEGCPDDDFAVWWSGQIMESDPPTVVLELQHYTGDCSMESFASVWVDLWELRERSTVWRPVTLLMSTGEVGEFAGTVARFDLSYDGEQVAPPEGKVIPIDAACSLADGAP